MRARILRLLLGTSLLLLLAIAFAVTFGASDVGLWRHLFGGSWGEVERSIFLHLRLPRVLAAAAVGGLLSLAGVAFQALLRNPLADPYVLGVSGGASLGGVLALVLGAGGLFVPVSAFAGAFVSLVAIERLATVGGRLTVLTLLLTGAIFNAASAALIYFLQSVASREELQSIVFYLMGRVPTPPAASIVGLVLAGVVLAIAFFAHGRDFNALALGEEGARQLGVDVERLKRRTFVLGSLATALAVATAGMIGFVGLVVPHILRRLFGPDNRLLLPAAFLAGGAFLVLADLVGRTVAAPTELPVGVVTALVGGPLFLVLLRRRHRRSIESERS
ncbi:MAG: FecCD family ABC transporter permease [Thermoanaerobaculia bacterium]